MDSPFKFRRDLTEQLTRGMIEYFTTREQNVRLCTVDAKAAGRSGSAACVAQSMRETDTPIGLCCIKDGWGSQDSVLGRYGDGTVQELPARRFIELKHKPASMIATLVVIRRSQNLLCTRLVVAVRGGLHSRRLFGCRKHSVCPCECKTLVLKGADHDASRSRLVGSTLRCATQVECGLPGFVLGRFANYTSRDCLTTVGERSNCERAPGHQLGSPQGRTRRPDMLRPSSSLPIPCICQLLSMKSE